VATRAYRSLRLRRESLTATPLVVAFHNVLARRVCISDSRLNQQQRRCGKEQKVFHNILPTFLKILELATDAAVSRRFEQRPCQEGNLGIEVSTPESGCLCPAKRTT
jgi:hypothetical protein